MYVCGTCCNYVSTCVPVRNTCIAYMYAIPVCNTCLQFVYTCAHVCAYMYAIPVRNTCCNYVYTCAPVLRICMRMHIIKQGGLANDDVIMPRPTYCGEKEIRFGEMNEWMNERLFQAWAHSSKHTYIHKKQNVKCDNGRRCDYCHNLISLLCTVASATLSAE